MQTSNAKQNLKPDGPIWFLFAELSLADRLSDRDWRDGPMAGYLFQTAQELGMPLQWMENIAETLAGFAQEALVHCRQEWLEFPVQIRIFCERKMIDDANSAKRARPHCAEQYFPDSEATTIGGWGYFMVERGGDILLNSSAITHKYVDLYLYREGE